MKQKLLLITLVTVFVLACSLGGKMGQKKPPALNQEQQPETSQQTQNNTEALAQAVTGVVDIEVRLDRKPGIGDCGIEPWYAPDCAMNMKMWWELHARAIASTPVLIVPDGRERWVVTSLNEAAAKYGINLDDYDYTPYVGKYAQISINPAATNPECSASISGSDFNFQVMGAREEGVTQLILSTNPSEHIEGSCGQAAFNWDTQYLLYGFAAALNRAPEDLVFQMNETFHSDVGTYDYEVELDTNPSPEKRDHVRANLRFTCMGKESAQVMAPTACPWEK
jgi:hypothetical protein